MNEISFDFQPLPSQANQVPPSEMGLLAPDPTELPAAPYLTDSANMAAYNNQPFTLQGSEALSVSAEQSPANPPAGYVPTVAETPPLPPQLGEQQVANSEQAAVSERLFAIGMHIQELRQQYLQQGTQPDEGQPYVG